MDGVGEHRRAPRRQHEQSERPDDKADATERTEDHRPAEDRIGRKPAEGVMINRRQTGRRKAEQESVERQVVKHAPHRRRLFALGGFGCAAATTAMQIGQVKRVAERLHEAGEARRALRAPNVLPAGAHTQREREDAIEPDRAEQSGHDVVRHQPEELALLWGENRGRIIERDEADDKGGHAQCG